MSIVFLFYVCVWLSLLHAWMSLQLTVMYKSLLANYFNTDINRTVIGQPSHVVTITHSTIQSGWTALQQASREGHQKVVELLLGAGAKPDLQNMVRRGWHMQCIEYMQLLVKAGGTLCIYCETKSHTSPLHCTSQTLVPIFTALFSAKRSS